MQRRLLRSLLFVLLTLTVACGRSQPTTYYAFPSQESSVVQDHLPKKTLRIARVSIPQYLERESIVLRNQDTVTFTVNPLHVWAEPLGDGIRRLVYGTFVGPLLQSGITVLPAATEATGTYTLLLDILALDASTGSAVISAQWYLTENANGTTLCDGLYSAQTPLPNTLFNTLVDAEAKLVKGCAEHILRQISATLAKKRP